VVATLEGGETVIRTLDRDGGAVAPTAAGERVHLHGVVVGLLRRYAPAG
jgi:hypothetical protein